MYRLLRHSLKRRRPGFTLLEILMAILIFTVAMSALTVTMRTGTRAWRRGHEVSELFQASRITQDVFRRDIQNMIFMVETSYNLSFYENISDIGERIDALRAEEDDGLFIDRNTSDLDELIGLDEENRLRDDDDESPELGINNIAPPIDLSFVGKNNGKTDSISFARRWRPGWFQEPGAWGIRRVTYEVEDGTLYRTEEDPFGLTASFNTIDNLYVEGVSAGDLALLFVGDDNARDLGFDPIMGRLGVEEEEIKNPLEITNKEPLCEGVEVFNITYEFYRQGEWLEVDEWNSSSREYRDPEIDIEEYGFLLDEDSIDETEFSSFSRLSMEQQQDYVADNLPGFMAVQLGIRAGGKGRLHSFTLYLSLDQAQEFDRMEEIEKLKEDAGLRSLRERRRERWQ